MHLLFGPLIFAVLHKTEAGNAKVTVAAVGMTCFFNKTVLQIFRRSLNGLILVFSIG